MKLSRSTRLKLVTVSLSIAMITVVAALGTTRPHTGVFVGGSSAQPAPAQPGGGLMQKNQANQAGSRPLTLSRD